MRDVGLASATDVEVWEYAKQSGFAIVSKDTDFSQRSFLLGFPPKVIGIKLGNCTTAQIENALRTYLTQIHHFESDQESSLLIIGPATEMAGINATIRYDSESQVLEIELRASGEIYRYFDVPPAEHEGLLKDPSKTDYLNSRIKGKYRFQKVL